MPQAPRAQQSMGCRRPCRRCRYRRHCRRGRKWVAGIRVFAAGTAGSGECRCRQPCCRHRHRRHCKIRAAGMPARVAGILFLHVGLRGLQASLPSSEAPQTLQITDSIHVCEGGRHPCRRRRHRRHGKTRVASILFLAAAIAGLAKCGLHASLPSSQAPQTLQIMGCRHACVGCRHACVGRRHRKHCKSWVQACLPVWSFKILKGERGGERVSGWGVCSIVSTTCL